MVSNDKEFTIADDKGVREVIIRAKGGVYVADAYSKSLEDTKTVRLFEGAASTMVQNNKGTLLVVSMLLFRFLLQNKWLLLISPLRKEYSSQLTPMFITLLCLRVKIIYKYLINKMLARVKLEYSPYLISNRWLHSKKE